MPVIYANLSIIIIGAFCLWKVHSDLRHSRKRSFFAALLVWLVYIGHTTTTAWASWNSTWAFPGDLLLCRGIGACLIVAGLCVVVSGMLEFRSLARISGRQPDRLVQTGIYRWTRNPQNVGWCLGLLGAAIYGQSAAALLLTLEFWVAFRLYIPWEEDFLEKTYREEWQQYRATTPRFFGLPHDFVYDPPVTLKIVQHEAKASTSNPVR